MVEKPKVDEGCTDFELWSIATEAGYLPKLEARWQEEDKRGRIVYKKEWHNLMGGLENLEDKHHEGKMTPEQEARYRELKRTLKEVIPIVKRLGFTLPSVPIKNA